MSRYVNSELAELTLQEVLQALDRAQIPHEVASDHEPLLLSDSLECAGEPVQVRISWQVLGTAQDVGLQLTTNQRMRIVHGEHDKSMVDEKVRGPLVQAALATRAESLIHQDNVGTIALEEGTLRIKLTF